MICFSKDLNFLHLCHYNQHILYEEVKREINKNGGNLERSNYNVDIYAEIRAKKFFW